MASGSVHGIATLGYSWIFHLLCEQDQNGACANYLTEGTTFTNMSVRASDDYRTLGIGLLTPLD